MNKGDENKVRIIAKGDRDGGTTPREIRERYEGDISPITW